MMVVNIDRVWHIIADLVEMGRRSDAEVLKNLKDEYIKLRSVYLFDSAHTLPGDLLDEGARLNCDGAPADMKDRDTFARWDFNLREDKSYGIERGSAVEWQWAQFVINGGPVTEAMVRHASTADPEGWKKAQYELEEEAA